ncbi:MAG: dihydroxy-acid dehydratase [Clostridia bacterium]|nr:dihydroxy-acid dehydratase [Clostridia bacterium]
MIAFARDMELLSKRAYFYANGILNEDEDKPLIGILTDANGLSLGGELAFALADEVAFGIRKKDALAARFSLSEISETVAYGHHGNNYALALRNQTADSIECLIASYDLAAIVVLPLSADFCTAALMAAARTMTPVAVMPVPVQPAKRIMDKNVSLCTVQNSVGEFKAGKLDAAFMNALQKSLNNSGATGGLTQTDNLYFALEALGLSLPTSSTLTSDNTVAKRIAVKTGETAVRLYQNKTTPKQAFERVKNALAVCFATGISADTLIALRAVTNECGLNAEKLINEPFNLLANKTPILVDLLPYGSVTVAEFHEAGGVPALVKVLNDAGLIEGCNAIEAILAVENESDTDIIHPINEPVQPNAGVCFLKGNLADRAMFNYRTQAFLSRQEVCKVYNSEEEAMQGIMSGAVKENTFVVLRYEGVKGGPGLRELTGVITALQATRLDESVILITDGRINYATTAGVISLCVPEAAEGGVIRALKDGDVIELDVGKHKLSVKLSSREVEARVRRTQLKEKEVSGVLKRFTAHATSPDQGVIFE